MKNSRNILMCQIMTFSHSLQKNLRLVPTDSGELDSETYTRLVPTDSGELDAEIYASSKVLDWIQPTENFHGKNQQLKDHCRNEHSIRFV